jgi:DNA-binding transcriptional MerR regulator/effector-binding domain-containing protein
MSAMVTIGEFSRLTHVSVKALRHYHEIGLLPPSEVDPVTGYRRYAVTQVSTAQLIRRLRQLDMPLPGVFAVVAAPDAPARDAAIRDHLLRMEAELDRTRGVVAALRSLLEPADGPLHLDHRRIGDLTALTLRQVVSRADIGAWCSEAFARLYTEAAAARVEPIGPAGATYDAAFFEEDAGAVLVYVPVPPSTPATSGLAPQPVPGGLFVVGVHSGPFTDFDRTYAAVGSHVAEHDTALPDPIREIYLAGPPEIEDPDDFRTEVCWPISA